MKKSKTVLFFGPLAAAALLLASCGSSSGISPDKSASKGTAGGATTTAADADTNPTGTAASKATTSAVSATTASSDCAQLVSNAKLVVYSLSDYCESTDPANPAPRADGGTIEALRKAGATVDSCPDNKGFRAYLTNKILLSPDNLANRKDLASHIPEVLGANTTVTDWQSNDSGVAVGTVTNSTQPLAPDGLLALQGDNYFVDVDWLGSASTTSVPNPNWTFRPGGPPEAATDPKLSTAAAKDSSVAVFDTPAVSGSSDIEANNKLDEMYGHGEFVSDLIYRHSGATANLMPVGNAEAVKAGMKLAGRRWSPMAFSEADLIVQIKAASAKTYTAWNMSLGAYACPGDAAFLPVLDLLASVHAAQPDLWIFAAAGNSGALQPHFPAALRHPDTVNSWDIKNPKARNKAQAASKALADVLHGVGSVEVDKNDTPTAKSAFSSCGTWIDSEEPGSSQIATYPAAPGKTAAQWSGTSFATARATARFLVATATGNGDKLQVADPKLFSNC